MTPDGTFLDVRTIGRFCYEDDLLTLSAVYTEAQEETRPGFPRLYTDKTINSLKHRLLVYLWKRAEQDGSATAKRRYLFRWLCFSYDNLKKHFFFLLICSQDLVRFPRKSFSPLNVFVCQLKTLLHLNIEDCTTVGEMR